MSGGGGGAGWLWVFVWGWGWGWVGGSVWGGGGGGGCVLYICTYCMCVMYAILPIVCPEHGHTRKYWYAWVHTLQIGTQDVLHTNERCTHAHTHTYTHYTNTHTHTCTSHKHTQTHTHVHTVPTCVCVWRYSRHHTVIPNGRLFINQLSICQPMYLAGFHWTPLFWPR